MVSRNAVIFGRHLLPSAGARIATRRFARRRGCAAVPFAAPPARNLFGPLRDGMFFRRPDSHLYAPQRLFLPAHPVSRPRTLGGRRNAPVRTLSGRTRAAGHPARPCGQSRRHPRAPYLAAARHPLRHHRAQQHLRARLNQAVAARSHAGGGGRLRNTAARNGGICPIYWARRFANLCPKGVFRRPQTALPSARWHI